MHSLVLSSVFLQHLTLSLLDNCTLVEYHKTKDLPYNFVAIGDSIMMSSPVYGLGVVKSCVGAAKLEGILATTQGPDLPKNFSKTFFQRQHACTAWSWYVARADKFVPT